MMARKRANTGKGSGGRMRILLAAVFFFFTVIVFRLCYLQIFRHSFYSAMAQDQHEIYEKIVPERGAILIRDEAGGGNYPVAVNKEMNLIYAVPRGIAPEKKAQTAQVLASALGLDYAEVLAKLSKPDDAYEVIKKRVGDLEAEGIRQSGLEGVGVAPDTFRYYPGGELAASVIGFLGYSGNSRVGQYGIESYCEQDLAGAPGFLAQEKDTSGNWISFGDKTLEPATDGKDVVLTLDYTVQYLVEKKLKEGVEKYQADSGSVIIMDPETGAIIAMANYPTYDLNSYSTVKDMSVFRNSAVSDVYEPGSIEKPITMAIGLDQGKISPNTVFTDTGVVRIDGWNITNAEPEIYGLQTMAQVLEKSLNTGTVFAQQQVEKRIFYDYLKKFGLGEPTGIELKGEMQGNLSNLDANRDINYATAAFGQGISVTPIGILTAISAFANDGKLMKPYLIDSYIDAGGVVQKTQPQVVRQVVSTKTANQVAQMMVGVTRNGTAKGAQMPGYEIASKTGTAQIASKDKKGYEVGRTIHTYVGFGPMPNPKFSALVKLDAPKALYAESTSVKVFHEIEEELVKYYHLAPTEPIGSTKTN